MASSRGSLLTVQCPFGCGGVHVTRIQVEQASWEHPVRLVCRGCEREFYYAGAGENRESWRVVLMETPRRARLAKVPRKKKTQETGGDFAYTFTHTWGKRDMSELPSHTGVGDVPRVAAILPEDPEADRAIDELVMERTKNWGWRPLTKKEA